MRFQFLITTLLFANYSVAQEQHPFDKDDFKSFALRPYNYVYSDINENSFLRTIETLIAYDNPDSSNKASKIMWGLHIHNPEKFSEVLFTRQITTIGMSNRKYYENALAGSWQFDHDFVTGLTNSTSKPDSADNVIIISFDGTSARFYKNKRLVRKTNYLLRPRTDQTSFTKFNRFDIYFTDKAEIWGFQLGNENYKRTLIIELDPSCSCGCRLDIYKRLD